jgi:hypothetical protein
MTGQEHPSLLEVMAACAAMLVSPSLPAIKLTISKLHHSEPNIWRRTQSPGETKAIIRISLLRLDRNFHLLPSL